jgi:hypothetical protein
MPLSRRSLLGLASALAAGLLGLAGPAAAQRAPAARTGRATPDRGRAGGDDLEKLAAEVVRSTREYRASLERLLAIYERDLATHQELVALRRDLHERGIISRRELEQAEQLLRESQENVDETRRWMQEADQLIAEAMAAELLARLAPLPRGGYQETQSLVAFNGTARWNLLSDWTKIQRFFTERFGRALPISAFGQSSVHDRIGFDHRNAMDVAVHPDSPEGRGLMGHLRGLGIPFVAFRGAVPGAATGAHIHIGEPSRRTSRSR